MPALIYGPAIVALVVLGAREGLGALEIVLLVLAGLRLDSVGVLASPQGLSLGPGSSDRPSPALHHPRRAPRSPQRSHAPGDAARRQHSARRSLLRLFWLIFGLPTALPLFAGFLIGYLMYDYTHYYLHHVVPRSKLGKRLREQHMRHHFQDHRYGFGSPRRSGMRSSAPCRAPAD